MILSLRNEKWHGKSVNFYESLEQFINEQYALDLSKLTKTKY
jgi:hypothetical protein